MGAKSDNSAQQLTLKQNQDTLALIERQTQRATRDVSKLFGSAEQNLLAGNQAAMDMYGQFAPQQFSAIQQGNMQAQQQLAGAAPQVQNALLGLPTDLSVLQPRQAQVDTSFLSGAQLPQFQTSQEALQLNQPEQAQEQQFAIDAEIGGLPYYTKSDFSVGGIGSQAEKNLQFQQALAGMTPEAIAQLRQQGAGAVGLGGDRGTALFNQLLGGQNPSEQQFRGMDKLRGWV